MNQNHIELENKDLPEWNKGYREALVDVLGLIELPDDTDVDAAIKYLLTKDKK